MLGLTPDVQLLVARLRCKQLNGLGARKRWVVGGVHPATGPAALQPEDSSEPRSICQSDSARSGLLGARGSPSPDPNRTAGLRFCP